MDVHYRLLETIIRVECNTTRWMDSLSSYLCMPLYRGTEGPHIRLSLMDAPERRLDDLIPLPCGISPYAEGAFLLGRLVPYAAFRSGNEQWKDFSGFGRSWCNFSTGEARAVRCEDSDIDPVNADILFGNNLLASLLMKAGFYSVHASCAEIEGKGILFTGDSGQGKSTAAFAMLTKGYPVIADDRVLVFLRGNYGGVGISDVIKMRKGWLKDSFAQGLPVKPYHSLDDEWLFKIGSSHKWAHRPLTAIHYLMVFEKTGEARTRLEKINPARVAGSLFPVTMNLDDPTQLKEKFDFLMGMLRDVPCYRVYFGIDMDDFVRSIEEVVRQ